MIDIPSPSTDWTNNVSAAEEQFCFGIVQNRICNSSNMLQAQEITSTITSHAASGHACQAHAVGGHLRPRLPSGTEAQSVAARVRPRLPRGAHARIVPAGARACKPAAHLHISVMSAPECLGQQIGNKSRGGGVGSQSPDLAISPPLSSPTTSDGVAMGAGGWPTGGEQNASTQERRRNRTPGLARGWVKKKKQSFFLMGGNCG
jgi:hypothetical protein